jgi:hypothetical protein
MIPCDQLDNKCFVNVDIINYRVGSLVVDSNMSKHVFVRSVLVQMCRLTSSVTVLYTPRELVSSLIRLERVCIHLHAIERNRIAY